MRHLVALHRATIALLLLSIGIGVLTIRGMTDTRRWTEDIDSALTDYALAEHSLQLNLLDERAGLLRNYDPVNADLMLAQNSLADLQRATLSERTRKILEKLIAKNDEREDIVEQFNSDNALLQNSLSYITHHASRAPGSQLLFNRILKLTLDTSPETVREAQEALEQMPPQPGRTPAARHISYARLLVDILPEIDGLLSSIRAMKMENAVNELQQAVREDALDLSRRVTQLQLALVAAIVLLIMTSATFLLLQRMHTRELEARAANEQLSAAIAIPLIDTGPGTFRSRAQEAADRLALHTGARRLQLAIPGVADSLQFSKYAILAPDWLAKLSNAAKADNAWFADRVIASSAEDQTDSALSFAMREVDVRELVLLRTAEPFRVMIGFEPEDFATAQRSDYLAGLSSALIAIAHSARREVMQLERERLEQRLAEKRRMANLGAIASGVAHNFNNIIGAVSGFAEIGQARTQAGSVEYESFEEIQGSVVRARELIDDILSYAKQRLSNKTPLDLVGLLNQTMRMLSASSRSNTAFQLVVPSEEYIVYGSESDLQQVFLNICNNAAYASEGRPVQISAQRSELAEKRQMSHDSLYSGAYAVVTITDSGPGIPKTLHPRLFEPFFTAKAGGTGLGLSTAWEIVQQHAGTIHVEKAKEGGGRFSIWLPEIATDANGAIVGNGARILLVTEPDRLSAEEDMLAGLGYEPLGFPINTESAKISEMIPSVDAVLIATWQSWRASKIMIEISPALDGRPLFFAAVDGDKWRHPVAAILLAYPIRADQISTLLSRTISGRMITDRARLVTSHPPESE